MDLLFENSLLPTIVKNSWSTEIEDPSHRTKETDGDMIQMVGPSAKKRRKMSPMQNNTDYMSDHWKTESNYISQYNSSSHIYQPMKEKSILDLIFNSEPILDEDKEDFLVTINNQPVLYPEVLPDSQYQVTTIVKTLCSTGIQSRIYNVSPTATSYPSKDLSLNHQTERLYHLIQFLCQQICSDFQKTGEVRIFINFPQKSLLFALETVSLSTITVKSLFTSIQTSTKEYFRPSTFLLNPTFWTVTRISSFSWLHETEHGEINYEYEWRKQGVVYTDNSDLGSMAKAIAISYAHSINHKAWTSLKLLHSGLQQAVATELCSRIGLPINCSSIYLIPKFEVFLRTRIVVWSAIDGNQIIYPGLQSLPPNKPIHIWLFCGHYFAITNPETLIHM